jgi:ferredoxin
VTTQALTPAQRRVVGHDGTLERVPGVVGSDDDPHGAHNGRVRVWIDQDLCTGDGLCTDHAPEVFTVLEDGIAYVCEAGRVLNDPGQAGALAHVPPPLRLAVVHAAEDCPGECIFLED